MVVIKHYLKMSEKNTFQAVIDNREFDELKIRKNHK